MFEFCKAKVLVIGDVMLDSYWHGETNRISPEAPVPVVSVNDYDTRPGGAANVALNIQSLGAKATVLGICGDDNEGMVLESALQGFEVATHLLRNKTLPTINKLRVLSQNQQLLRLDFERSYADIDKGPLLQKAQALISQTDAVVISDYAKGTLSHVSEIIDICNAHQVPVLVDPKGCDYHRYQGATLLTPNRHEFELLCGQCDDEQLIVKGQQMLAQYQLKHLLVTRGAEGMTLLGQQHAPFHLKAQAKAVYDVTGAGDTVIGVLAASLATGLKMNQAVELANYAAGLVVAKVGTATVSHHELKPYFESHKAAAVEI